MPGLKIEITGDNQSLSTALQDSQKKIQKTVENAEAMGMKLDKSLSQMAQTTAKNVQQVSHATWGDINKMSEDIISDIKSSSNKTITSVEGTAQASGSAVQKVAKETQQSVEQTKKSGEDMGGLLKNLAMYAAAYFTANQAVGFAKQVANVRGEFQQLEVAFTTMLGSKEKADELMRKTVDFAAKTPFDLQGVAQGTKQLLAYGSEASNVTEELKMLGNIAAGLSIPLNDIVYLYGTTRTQGRLYTQDLRQFMGRGIPIAEELAKQFGVTKDKVGDLVTAGKVGFPEVEKALQSMTSAGGKFYNLMDEQSKTISGKISNLGDSISQMFNEIGKSSEGVINSTLEGAAWLIENYKAVAKEIGGLIVAYGAYKAAMITAVAVQNAMAIATKANAIAGASLNAAQVLLVGGVKKLILAFKALNVAMLSNPYALVAASVATLAYGIYKLITSESEAEKATRKLNEKMEKQKEAVQKEREEVDQLIDKLKDETITRGQRVAALNELIKRYPTIFKDYIDEKGHITDLIGLQKALNEARGQEDVSRLKNNLNADKKKADLYQAYLSNSENGGSQEERTKIMSEYKKIFGSQMFEGRTMWTKDTTYAKAQLDTLKGDISKQQSELSQTELNEWQANHEKLTDEQLKEEIKSLEENARKKEELMKGNAVGRYANQMGFTTAEEQKKINILSEILSSRTSKSLKNNEATYKAKKEELEEELKNLDVKDASTENQNKISELKQKISYIDSVLDKYGISGKKSSGSAKTDYSSEYIKQTQELAEASYQRGIAIREAEINGMEDGLDKLLAQNDLSHEKQMHQLEAQNKDAIEKLNNSYKTMWQQKGNSGDSFSIDKYFAKYPEEVKKYNDEVKAINIDYQKQEELLLKNNNNKNTEETKDYLDGLYGEYKGYLDKRKDIEEKYATIEKDIEKKAPEEQKESLNSEAEYKKQVELESLDAEFAQREQAYQNWLDSISNLTLKSLEIMLAKAKDSLSKLEKSGSLNGKELAKSRAQVAALEKEIGKAKIDPKRRTLKEWKDLTEILSGVANQFSEIGDAVGGTQGEILKDASVIATTTLGMISNITQLAEISQNATITSANTASKAIQAVEKASVILAIISAAIQLLQALQKFLPNSFQEYEKYAAEIKEINKLTQAVDAYNIALQKSKAERESWFGADSLKSLKDYKKLQSEIFKAYTDKATESQAIYKNQSGGGFLTTAINNLIGWLSPLSWTGVDFWKNLWGINGYEKGQTAAINNLRIETKKKSSGFLGTGIGGHSQQTEDLQTWINKKAGWEDAKLFDEMGFINTDLAQTIIDEYGDKLVGETKETIEALMDLKKQYDEYLEQLHEYVAEMYEPLIENFTDSLWDWFDEGKDALKSFKEYASDTFRDIVTDMMKTIVLEKVVGSFQDDISKLYEKYSIGELSEADLMKQVSELTSDLMGRYETQIPALQEMMQQMAQQIKDTTGIDINNNDLDREASEKGIAQASQDTVDELNGRMTVIQSHTYEINATTKALLQNSNITLSHLANIESNTARLLGIEIDMHSVKSTLEDINTRGILLR